ncbi:hypothetical protein Cni_G19563 [Canna indica]|uniref:Uncharacterized protein n=1 Tax=Canna indica TaxID=4628 RepID=A0AAQ3KMD5_9LILI|nr:hypothetical protein Cni_G19563 [Canna indica]
MKAQTYAFEVPKISTFSSNHACIFFPSRHHTGQCKKPEEKRFLLDVASHLEEPVEERSVVALVRGHVAGVLAEAHRRLDRELNHAVALLLLEGLAVEVTCSDARIRVTRRRVGEERERSRRR